MKSGLAVAVIMTALTSGTQAQDVAAGEQSFKKCLPCHSIGEGAKNKVGPVLNGLEGRHSGSIPEYSYSDANKNSGLTWDDATFKDYIKGPACQDSEYQDDFSGHQE
jgi:cytochrome c